LLLSPFWLKHKPREEELDALVAVEGYRNDAEVREGSCLPLSKFFQRSS